MIQFSGRLHNGCPCKQNTGFCKHLVLPGIGNSAETGI
jgi:hypothetical protein